MEAETKFPHRIAFFGGQGCKSAFSRDISTSALSYIRNSSLASLLLSSCHAAFLEELVSSAAVDNVAIAEELKCYESRESLLSPENIHRTNPVIQGISLCIHQLLCYLKYVESEGRALSPASSTAQGAMVRWSEVVGFCSGVLPAAVAATSRTIDEYIEGSRHAIRLSFWIGLRVSTFCEKRAGPHWRHTPWSMALFGIGQDYIDLIKGFNASNQFSKLHISAKLDARSVTVSGPGEALQSFQSTYLDSATPSEFIPVHALYHGGEDSKSVVEQILCDADRRNIIFPSLKSLHSPIRSTANGELISTSDLDANFDLIHIVLRNILVDCVDWRITWEIINEGISQDDLVDRPQVQIHAFGPYSPSLFSCGGIKPDGAIETIDHSSANDHGTPFWPPESIAIVGMSVDFPGGSDKNAFWKTLDAGVSTVESIPASRFKISEYSSLDKDKDRKARCLGTSHGNFLQCPWAFDHSFFGISPREAKLMDPQQKLLLQSALEALDDAGYVPDSTPSFQRNSFGCYVGVATGDYVDNLKEDIDVHYSTGTLRAFLSGKISYAFKFSGPSVTLDTACSASSVSIHQACRALSNGDCNAAIAGGVNVVTSPDMYIGLSRAHFLSPTGQCKAFDTSADGYCRAEGCGLFVLKRLGDAVFENDRIYGVIRGVAMNQCGNACSITHPHSETQAILFQEALSKAGLEPRSVNVVEAHGTGTQAGDAAEMSSIQAVFGNNHARGRPVHITSLKANIGHAEAASGAAGLAKILLMFREGKIPPQAGLVTFNPRLSVYKSPNMRIATEEVSWKSDPDSPRIAMLNNFGAAGSNVAMLIQEFTAKRKESHVSRTAYPFSISARTASATKRLCESYVEMLKSADMNKSIEDVCYTATARRQMYDHRVSIACGNLEDLLQKLHNPSISTRPSTTMPLILVFSGQGGVYLEMGRELLATAPVFRDSVDRCERLLRAMGFPSVLGMLDSSDASILDKETTVVSQTACFVVQYSLARMWLSWNIKPSVVLGHSLGEFAAFVTAGALSLEDGLRLVARRAQLMVENCSSRATGMLSCNLGHDDITSLISSQRDTFSELTVACQNSRQDSVVSGPLTQLRHFSELCENTGHKCKLLDVPYGFHSAAMDSILPALKEYSLTVTFYPPKFKLGSTVHGRLISFNDLDSEYFVRQTRGTVRFADLIHNIDLESDLQSAVFLEIGPSPLTLPLIRRNVTRNNHEYLSSLTRQERPWTTLSSSLLKLANCHCNIDWREVFSGTSGKVVDAPPYPLEKSEHFVPYEEPSKGILAVTSSRSDLVSTILLRRKVSNSENGPTAFESDLESLSSYIKGHVVGGVALCPASVYYAMVLEGLQVSSNRPSQDTSVVISEIVFQSPLVYVPNSERTVRLELRDTDDGRGNRVVQHFACSSISEAASSVRNVHVTGNIGYETVSGLKKRFLRKAAMVSRQIKLLESNGGRLDTFHTRLLYETVFPRVVLYAENYRSIRHLKVTESGLEGFGVFQLPRQAASDGVLSPAFADSIIHAAGFIANSHVDISDAYICVKIERIAILQDIDPSASYCIYCSLLDGVESNLLANSYAVDSSGAVIAAIEGMNFKKVQLRAFQTHLRRQQALATLPATPSSDGDSSSTMSDTLDSESASSVSAPPGPEDVPTTKAIDESVARVVLRVTGATSHAFSPDSRLVDLGVDSMLAIELYEELRKTFPLFTTEISTLLQLPTVRDLQSYVALTETSMQNVSTAPVSLPATSETSWPQQGRNSGPQKRRDNSSKIRKVIAQVCGVADSELQRDLTLDALGIDSLLTIELQHSLRRELGDDVSHIDFDGDMTIGDVASLLGSGSSDSKHEPSPARSAAQSNHQSKVVKPVLLRRGAAGSIPLVLFHDGSGLADMYSRLPDLGCSLFGVPNPGFGSDTHWAHSLEEMATQYVSAVESFGCDEVILGGWSFGGVLAYEIAQQLSKLGKRVRGTILIDSPFPQAHQPLPGPVIECVLKKLKPAIKVPLLLQFQTHAQLLANYNARRDLSNARFVFLQSEKTFDTTSRCGVSYPWLEDSARRAQSISQWEELIGRKPLVLPIPGDHFEPFLDANINVVAGRLREAYEYIIKEA